MQTQLPVLDLRMNLVAPDVERRRGGRRNRSPTRSGRASCECSARGLSACAKWRPPSEPAEQCEQPPLAAARRGLVRAARYEPDSRRVYYERDEVACRRALKALEEILG